MGTRDAVKRLWLSLFPVSVLSTMLPRSHRFAAADQTQTLAVDRVTKMAGIGGCGRCLCLGLLLLSGPFVFGCATVVTPLQPGDLTSVPKPDHGLVLGRVHLVWNGKDQQTGIRRPLNVRWRITEEQSGTQLVMNHVPIDGPFVFDLPAGSYRLMVVSFDNSLGVWQTSLPATFSVRPQECTYLGTWELTMQTKLFSGSITRQVFDQRELAQRDLRATITDDHGWPPMVAQLVAPMQGSLALTFRTQGTELTSPP